MGGLVWFSVHCFFETPIYSPQILAMLMIIFGIVVSVGKIHQEEGDSVKYYKEIWQNKSVKKIHQEILKAKKDGMI